MAKKLDISKLVGRLKELEENSNRGGGSGSGMSFINIKDGRNVIRILPPSDKMESFYEEAWVHYGVGKGGDNKKGTMVVCPKTKDENAPCPVCEASEQLYKLSKKKDDNYSKQAKQLYRKKRVYYNAINRAENLEDFELRTEDVNGEEKQVWYNKTTDEKESPVKVLATGVGVFKDILKLICDPEYGDITDAEEGLDLIIEKSGSGQFNTKYDVRTVRKESEIGMDGWENHLNDISPLLKAKSYDDIVAIMDGEEPTEDSDEELEEKADKATDILPDKNDSEDDDDDMEAEIRAALAKRKAGK